MVAPLDNVRPLGQTPPATPARPRPPGGIDFAAELERATQQLAASTERAPLQPFDVDPLLEIQQATQAMQRASSHAQAARAYFRSAQPTDQG
jgi:hypothetical protein